MKIIVSCLLFPALLFISSSSKAQSQSTLNFSERASMLESSSPVPPSDRNDHDFIVSAPNAIYIELLGAGLIYSVNYDRLLMNNLGLRIGIGYLPFGTTVRDNSDGTSSTVNASITTVPVTVSWYPFSSDNSVPSSKLEIGAGIFYADLVAKTVSNSAEGSGVGFTGIFGYRLQPADGGFIFRAAFTPWILFGHFQPYGGISLGYGF